jgi:predicted nucleotidyltransferase
LRKVEIVNAGEVEVKSFILNDFIQKKEQVVKSEKVSKKVLKQLAKELGLNYDNEQLQSSKKLFEAYLAQR